MMVRARENVGPAHLGVVCRAIKEALELAGNATPVLIGEHYATNPRGIGAPPCVILVPEPGGGACEMAPAYETGRAMMQVHHLDIIVRAAETGDDASRIDPAYDLSDLVANVLRRVCAGKLTPSRPVGSYPSPFTSDTGAGAQLCWGITYERDIPLSTTVLALAPSAADTTPAAPYAAAGDTGTLDTATGTVTPAT